MKWIPATFLLFSSYNKEHNNYDGIRTQFGDALDGHYGGFSISIVISEVIIWLIFV